MIFYLHNYDWNTAEKYSEPRQISKVALFANIIKA